MKKNVIAILCVILAVIAVIAFSTRNKSDNTDTTTAFEAITDTTTEDNTPELQEGTKNPEKLIKITMPLSYYDAKNQCDVGGFFDKSSYKKCEINEKQKTFTVTLRSITHDFMLSNVGLQVIKSLASLLDSGDYPYLKQLGKYNSDFSEIELKVDATGYRATSDAKKMVEFVASCGIFYQIYTTENSYKCTVTVIDYETGKKLDEFTAQQTNKLD